MKQLQPHLASIRTKLGLLLHLRHLRQEGDLHFLALRGQTLKQRLAGPLRVEDGGLITLQEKQNLRSGTW